MFKIIGGILFVVAITMVCTFIYHLCTNPVIYILGLICMYVVAACLGNAIFGKEKTLKEEKEVI